MTELTHIPVLPGQVLEVLTFPADREALLIDGTLGNGGHSKMLLARYPKLRLLGIDRDADALKRAAENLRDYSDRVVLRHGEFSAMRELAASAKMLPADGILLDIGVSSPQIDDPARGFSWRLDGPLDMRMNRESPLTASRLLNSASQEELTRIFREYGEIKPAYKLARAVVETRAEHPFGHTGDFAELCERVLGRGGRRGGPPAPTLPFQALRIAVNDELGELERALDAALGSLKTGGVLAVISFHSLEDRIVKNFFREKARGCVCPPGLPICICHHSPEVELITRGTLVADDTERAANRRAASARLRAARKLEPSTPSPNS